MSDLTSLLDATLRLLARDLRTGGRMDSVKPGGFPSSLFVNLTPKERERFECSICYQILKNPYHCSNMHYFCYPCIRVWQASGTTENHDCCPACRAVGTYLPDDRMAGIISKKFVRCPQKACIWTGPLKNLQFHQHTIYNKLFQGLRTGELPKVSYRIPEKFSNSSVASGFGELLLPRPPPVHSPSLPQTQRRLPRLSGSTHGGPSHQLSANHREGLREIEQLRTHMHETRLRLEQIEASRQELVAQVEDRYRMQHLVEVRDLGRRLNQFTMEIRDILKNLNSFAPPRHTHE